MSATNPLEELILAKRVISFQKVEILTLTKELGILKEALIDQNIRKNNSDEALTAANRRLDVQNDHRKDREEELILANKELAFQNSEKQRRADELIVANKELGFQRDEKQNRADELILANKELAYQQELKAKRAKELKIAYKELKKTEEFLKEYIKGLEEMMFITSHKVRQPVAQILGISMLLDLNTDYSVEELKEIVSYIKSSAISLDDFTRELSQFMDNLKTRTKD